MAKKRFEFCKLHPDVPELLETLCAAGARFLPVTGTRLHRSGLYDQEPMDANECAEWLSVPGKRRELGFEPYSLELACLDFDGDRGHKSHPDVIREQAELAQHDIGDAAFSTPSRSGPETGKTHLFYGIDSKDAPIGRLEDGRPRFLLTSTPTHGYYADSAGPGSGSVVDIRCRRSMVILPSLLEGSELGAEYLRGLAGIIEFRAEGGETLPPEPSWHEYIAGPLSAHWLKTHKPASKPPSRAPRGTDVEDVDTFKLREYNQARLDKYNWTEGHRYAAANGLGYCAGMENRWNKLAEPMYREMVRSMLPESYMAVFERGMEDGQRPGNARPVPWDHLLTREAMVRAANAQAERDAAAQAEAKPGKPAKPAKRPPPADRPLALPEERPSKLLVASDDINSFNEGLAHVGLAVRYNEMAVRLEYRCGGPWAEPDEASRAAWICRFEQSVQIPPENGESGEPKDWRMGDQQWNRKVFASSDSARHHPGKDFLAEVIRRHETWKANPTSHLKTLFTGKEKFGAAATEINRLAPYLILGQTLKRVMEPGCRVRGIVILIGGQKYGKSAFVESLLPFPWNELAGQHFPLTGTTKEMWEAIRGSIVVEIADMLGVSKAAGDRLKKFVTQTKDTGIRPAYGISSINVPRWCSLVGTADKNDCLPHDDADGDRGTRWIPVKLGRRWRVEPWMQEHAWDIWCETYDRLLQGEAPELPDALRAQHAALIRQHSQGFSLDTDIVYRQISALEDGKAKYYNGEDYVLYGPEGAEDSGYALRPGSRITAADFQRLSIVRNELFDDRNPDRAKQTKLGQAIAKSGRFATKKIERVASRIGGERGRGYALIEEGGDPDAPPEEPMESYAESEDVSPDPDDTEDAVIEGEEYSRAWLDGMEN